MPLKLLLGTAIALTASTLTPLSSLASPAIASGTDLAKDLKSVGNVALAAHNRYRARHRSPAMTYDHDLANSAQAWSRWMAREGRFTHSNRNTRNGAGENLYVSYTIGTESEDAVVAKAVKGWYDEVQDYNYDRPGFSAETGHFTQVVWKGSTRLGCGVAQGRKTLRGRTYNAYYVTCHYGPAGNMRGRFPTNVLKP